MYLIFSKVHTNGIALWWRPNGAGYTTDIRGAGHYSEEEAKHIQENSHGDNIAVPFSAVQNFASRLIIDMGDGMNWQLMKKFS